MQDVFRAVTLSFLVATLYLVLCATVDYVEIFSLRSADLPYAPGERFRMALATATLLASLLCVWVLLVMAFSRRYVARLRPRTTLITALSVAVPIVLMKLLLGRVDPRADWSPGVNLVFSLLWASIGLHALLGYFTLGAESHKS